jgi:hypothetical protein
MSVEYWLGRFGQVKPGKEMLGQVRKCCRSLGHIRPGSPMLFHVICGQIRLGQVRPV